MSKTTTTELTAPAVGSRLDRGVSWRALLRGWLPTKEARRTVFLVMYDGDMKIAKAYRTQSGWSARWIDNDDQWSVLLPNGKVIGTTLVKGWLPHNGWTGDEFAS